MMRYILVADEMGTPGMAPGTSNSFVFGGFVVDERHLPLAIQSWRSIKRDTCGSADVELKWKHFFTDPHDSSISSPLRETDPRLRRRLAVLALDQLFKGSPVIPDLVLCRKDRVSDTLVVESGQGKPKLDHDLLWLGPVGLFGAYLHARRARGKLWFDQLGSQKHQERWQAAWSEQLSTIRAGECHPAVADNLPKLLAIDENIEFWDSKSNEAVQIADFICGVIWQAAEGDESLLARVLDQYGPKASRHGLGILRLQ
jgi:hypothetical protein